MKPKMSLSCVVTIPKDVVAADNVLYRPGYLRILWRFADGTTEWWEHQALITGEVSFDVPKD